MEDQQHLENKFRETLKDLERTPSESAWKGIRTVLHPAPPENGPWPRMIHISRNSRILRISAGIAATAVIVFVVSLWVVYKNHHTVRGHAYAGESRLSRGTAYLFKVEDKARPYDSIKHYGSAVVDEEGFYRFINVSPGKYFLRVIPESNSPDSGNYEPSWFDQHKELGEAHLLNITSDDLEVDVHLVPGQRKPQY